MSSPSVKIVIFSRCNGTLGSPIHVRIFKEVKEWIKIFNLLSRKFVANSFIGCPLKDSIKGSVSSVDAYVPERGKIYTRFNAPAQDPRSYNDDIWL
jgi:hypothetical protein